jgi:hypothetical protein
MEVEVEAEGEVGTGITVVIPLSCQAVVWQQDDRQDNKVWRND